MGELLICHEPIAEIPYYLDGIGINIYSVEELCYYILANTYLLDGSFMNEELCIWIEKQMGQPKLAGHLQELIRSGVRLSDFVAAILERTSYCSRKEVQEILFTIRQMEEKSDFECGKIRADKLMEKEKYLGAIYEYRRLLAMDEADGEEEELCGNIWHNLGTAYARLFLFAEAGNCYEKAFGLNAAGESLRECLLCFLCMHDNEGFEKMAEKYHVDDMGMQEIKNELSIAGKSEKLTDFYEKIKEPEKEMPSAKRDEIILQWKEEYRRSCRV